MIEEAAQGAKSAADSAKSAAQSTGSGSDSGNSNKSRAMPKIGGAPFNTKKNSNPRNSQEEFDRTAKTAANSAVAAGKATAQAFSGDVVGAAGTIASDEGFRKIIIGIVAIVLIIPIMMFSLVPTLEFLPLQSITRNILRSADSLLSLCHIDFSLEDKLNESIFSDLFVDDSAGSEKDYVGVIADQETRVDFDTFDTAPEKTQKTMQSMIAKTKKKYEKRHNKILREIDDDFNERKDDLPGTVTKIVNDPLSNGSVATDAEAVKLMCLYTVQTDGETSTVVFGDDGKINVEDDVYDNYMDWLGSEESAWFSDSDEDIERYPNWKVIPKKWKGSMLPQKQMDEAREAKRNNTFKKEDYEEYYTSALGEILTIDPEVKEETFTSTYTDELGIQHTTIDTYVTYTVKVASVDEISHNIVKFDEAVDMGADGSPSRISGKTYREEWLNEMIGTGEGQGVALAYFGISNGGLYGGGSIGFGNGADIVRVALSQVGVVETGTNNVLYNTWYYGHTVNGDDFPWCAAFVSWCADQCGFTANNIIPRTAWCGTFGEFYGAQGRKFSVTDTSFTPQPGDLIIRGGNAHVGIVEKYEDGVLYTIEGNSGAGISDVNNNGGCVARHAYGDKAPATNTIVGAWYSTGYYCRPAYPSMGADGVGAVCFAFETGDQILGKANPWYCEMLNDGAGMNYGMMSTNREQAQNMYNYIIAHSQNFRNQIGSKAMFSSAFNDWWKGAHSEADTQEMATLQSEWVWQAYGEPACQGEYSFMKRSRALQEAALSRAVHRGSAGARDMFRRAGITESMTDAQIIDAIYTYEQNNLTAGAYTSAVRQRMVLERQMIIDNFL